MIIYLNVPYKDKDVVKKYGAKWNNARHQWYVEDLDDLTPFIKYMDKRLLKPHEGVTS